jgi:hypothetical protein
MAYWKMENNWNDSIGDYSSEPGWSVAGFTTDAKLGGYAGSFNGMNDYVLFPFDLRPSSAITISAWIRRDQESLDDPDTIHTIFSKGAQENNNHIWLYAKGDNYYFELGNGEGQRRQISSAAINPKQLDLHLKSELGRWDVTQGWVTDTVTSQCINAGDPASDYSEEPAPNGGRVNLGAFANTTQASQ